jgi:hypothetical protein
MAASPAPVFTSYEEAAEVHIVIAGCGRVRLELASNVQRLCHTDAVIDESRKARGRLTRPIARDSDWTSAWWTKRLDHGRSDNWARWRTALT